MGKSHHSRECDDTRHKRKHKRDCDSERENNLENNEYYSLQDNIEEKDEDDKNCADKVTIENCKTTVTAEMLPLCDNVPYVSEVTLGPVTVKIPVVLTECNVTITVQSSVKLEDAILEIKHIRKNVYLNQCKLMPNSEDGKPNTRILFMEGFIRKNIEYAAVSKGKIKHTTVKVPFKCATRVTLNTLPKFKTTTSQEEVEILKTNVKVYDSCDEDFFGVDTREQSFKLSEFFNEKVFCELISAEIIESDILEEPTDNKCESSMEQSFRKITERVVLFLTIKLLQNQHVEIPKI